MPLLLVGLIIVMIMVITIIYNCTDDEPSTSTANKDKDKEPDPDGNRTDLENRERRDDTESQDRMPTREDIERGFFQIRAMAFQNSYARPCQKVL